MTQATPSSFLWYRETIELALGVGFIAFGFALRLFVFVHLGWGTMLVYLCWCVGYLLIKDSKRIAKGEKHLS
jgi:hypothetical protein